MLVNRSIPGQLRDDEQVAIALVASLVPKNGRIVEVGSLLGKSSWIWAKNADPSVTVYCLDPWVGGGNFAKLASDANQTFSLQQFKTNVADCPNIVPMEGYSPRDFRDWTLPIDLYFEDAVHTDPILSENLSFWGGKLVPTGILCGHDYSDRFPDVQRNAKETAARLNRELHLVGSFWFILPRELQNTDDAQTKDVLAQLRDLENYEQTSSPMAADETFIQYSKRVLSQIKSFEYVVSFETIPAAVKQGEPIVLHGLLKNASGENWPVMAHGTAFLKLGAELRTGAERRKVAVDRYWFDFPILKAGKTVPFEIILSSARAEVGPAEIYLDLVYDWVLWFEQKGAKSQRLRIDVEPSLKFARTDPSPAFGNASVAACNASVPSAYQAYFEDIPSDWSKVSELDIHSAYRIALGRPPEGGRQMVLDRLKTIADLSDLRYRFLSSPEFFKSNFRALSQILIGNGYRLSDASIEVATPSDKLIRLFRHVQNVWSRLGEIEPHHSVFTADRFKPEALPEHEKEFYASGSQETSLALERVARLTGTKPAQSWEAVEFGCGLGRVTRFLSSYFTKVTAYDISKSHLDLARRYFERQNIVNVDLRWISRPEGFEVPEHDFFYSRIVFQHNPPPISAYFLDKILSKLRPNGVAMFQIITAIDGYTFDTDSYITAMDKIDNQELHALPQHEVFRIVANRGLVPLEVIRDLSVPGFNRVSMQFMAVKPIVDSSVTAPTNVHGPATLAINAVRKWWSG